MNDYREVFINNKKQRLRNVCVMGYFNLRHWLLTLDTTTTITKQTQSRQSPITIQTSEH